MIDQMTEEDRAHLLPKITHQVKLFARRHRLDARWVLALIGRVVRREVGLPDDAPRQDVPVRQTVRASRIAAALVDATTWEAREQLAALVEYLAEPLDPACLGGLREGAEEIVSAMVQRCGRVASRRGA